MGANKAWMTGHVRTPEKRSTAVIRFNPPAIVLAVRIVNRLVASDSVFMPNIERLPSQPVSEWNVKGAIEPYQRLIINTKTPTEVSIDWTEAT